VENGGDTTGARGYADLGDHVASILTAAEQAAEQIRSDAAREAESLRATSREEAQSHTQSERRRATDEAERLVSAAVADARAIRDTARAAATRIAEEGQRRLQELRLEARGLEGRFETAVDELHDLIAQLDDVVQDSVRRPEPQPAASPEESDGPAEDETPVRDLWPRAVADPPQDEPAWDKSAEPDEQRSHRS
jgi:hypothetical protein